MTINALRTPDERFAALPGYDFAPHYMEAKGPFAGLRLHYVDEGPREAAVTFLCLHGEPTWAYLYRKMIPVFVAAGHRVVAPDFFGFGRSDKPVDEAHYTFSFHRNTLIQFIDHFDLKNVCLVVQDWGGLIGLTLPMDMHHNRFTRLLVMNTAIAQGTSPGQGFEAWKAYAASMPDLPVGTIIKRAHPPLSEAERAAYDAPFPDASYKAGARRFPQIVPVTPDMEGADLGRRAASWWQTQWSGPSFMAVGMQDPVLGPAQMKALRMLIRGCPDPLEVPDAGHFVQERGEGVARAALERFALA